MDKNNDIKVYKISKWKEAPDSIKDLYSTINATFAALSLRNRCNELADKLRKKCTEIHGKNKLIDSLRRTVRFLDEGGSYELHSCPVACECENFKPKVHHSYDPLDDLPDVEHS